jgi:hypothetical protein
MLATGWAMSAASVFRAGVGCVELWSERAPALLRLGAEAREATADAPRARAQFRDELIAAARDSSEIAVRELHRGLEDLDAFTRVDEELAGRPRRPYKAKP